MNDEIKEILDDMKDKCKYIEDYGYQYKRLSLEDAEILLDYITNLQEDVRTGKEINAELQQENERLKEEQEYNNYCDEQLRKKISNLEYKITTLEDYKSRCEKASEYVKSYGKAYMANIDYDDLLNILQNGSDDNE